MTQTITFIGGGNMAASLIGGLIANGYPTDSIRVAEPSQERRDFLSQQYAVHSSTDNASAVASTDIIMLAVKPQALQSVCRELAGQFDSSNTLIISIAAGIRTDDINRWLGGDCAIVRCMPNTPSLVQLGATGLFANHKVRETQRHTAESILAAVGITCWVQQETQLDAVTALSGSGPAYFFLLMEAMQKVGIAMGLDAEVSRQLTLQTALGAARMAMDSDDDAATLRQKVTSPGGTTEAAIHTFQSQDFEALVQLALNNACLRADELAEQLGKDA